QQLQHDRDCLTGFYDFDSAGRSELFHDVPKILRMWPDHDGLGKECRLQDVVPAAHGEPPADDGYIRQTVNACQLADRIQQKDSAGQARAGPLRAPLESQPVAGGGLRNLTKALRMPRRHDHQRAWIARYKLRRKVLQQPWLFPLDRAAADDHWRGPPLPNSSAHLLNYREFRRRRGVEFQISRNLYPLCRSADIPQPPTILFRLRAE